MTEKELKSNIIQAGYKAVHELIRVAEDRLKNAAATKKLAIFDAFEILSRIETEKNIMEDKPIEDKKSFSGFAEKRSR